MERIFHIAEADRWAAAQSVGEYRCSTLGKTLEDVGFIHCSRIDQVEGVANAVYRGQPNLVLLVIERAKVRAAVRDENLAGGDDPFPHIYGPLNSDAVIEVVPFRSAADGRFRFPT